ncbi:MAG: carbohydrate-binding domain-containing protein [Lachnospiraceae bacterium]|nr:carbohydrate-binding domain-containing protein [Lachnospiraceae bacterium]
MDNITLTSKKTAPICCNKSTDVEIIAKENTVNTLSDTAENANSENSDAENAVIKAKSGASLKIGGTGTLNINGVGKNGIKGAAETTVTVDALNLNVTAANNGIASDHEVIINGGTIDVDAVNEGIKSEPENTVDETTGEVTLVDTVSAGKITVNGGSVSVQASGDGVQAYNEAVINTGSVKVNSLGDGIQATNLTINNGNFDITTNGGCTTALASDANSCKGLKATSTIRINNGNFNINSADDAIHTNEYVYLLGGTFNIKTGDDGAHADTSLFVGEENAEDGKLNINVLSSYEALEAGTVYFYSGNVNVTASDDGVNAAGGSSNGSDFGNGWNNGFTPGGGGRPGFGSQISQGSTGDYSLNIHGGNIYIDCGADGLDSNGNINMSGGNVIVFGAASGSDNTAFDYDGQFALTGGSIFGAGSSRMAMAPTASVSTQKYITLNSTVEQGKNIVVNDSSSNILFATKAIKNVNFVVYSSPELANGDNYTISATNEAVVTNVPTVEPTVEPSTKPTVEPTKKPTKTPTTGPIVEPTMEPGIEPTAEPTAEPTVEPTTEPTGEPTAEPTVEPTAEPTAEPTTAPVTKEKINVKATSKNGKYTKIKTINNEATTSYTNKNLNCGKTYYYIVKGYKNINNTATCIAESKVSSAKVIPVKATLKTAKLQNNKVTLKWKKENGVSGYEVYRATSKNGKYKKVKTITSSSKTTYADKNLKAGKKYYYKIRTYKTVNGKKVYGEYSAVKTVKIK